MPELPEVETVMRGLQARLEGRALRARGGAPAGSALAAARRPGAAADRRAGHRVPPARQIHPDAAGRRLIGAAASRHVRPHGAGAGAAERSRRCTSTWCWKPTTAGASASSIRAASARSTWCATDAGGRSTGCWPAWGRSRWRTRFTPPVLSAALAGKRTPIKAALLDQKVVAGLGNIYVCEALFRARHLAAAAGRTPCRARARARLVPAIKATLTRGDRGRRIVAAGLRAAGRRARLFPACLEGLRPRGRALRAPAPARRPAHGVRRIVQSGRSTFYCPRTQR